MGVARKSQIAAFLGERGFGFVVDSEVEHRVHHAGHRHGRARPHRHEQRTRPDAEASSGPFLEPGNAGRNFVLEARRRQVTREKSGAGPGRHDEGRRYVKPKRLHPRDRPRLAADQFARQARLRRSVRSSIRRNGSSSRRTPILRARAASGARDLRAVRTTACDSSRSWRR